jgi:hypothetical protein
MISNRTLPAPFDDLEVFLDWALPTETLRRQKREASSMEDIGKFYSCMLPWLPKILEHFREAEQQAGGPGNVGEQTKLLFALMLALAEASLSIEVHKSPIVPNGMPGDIWKPEHETTGWRQKAKIKLFPKAPSLLG